MRVGTATSWSGGCTARVVEAAAVLRMGTEADGQRRELTCQRVLVRWGASTDKAQVERQLREGTLCDLFLDHTPRCRFKRETCATRQNHSHTRKACESRPAAADIQRRACARRVASLAQALLDALRQGAATPAPGTLPHRTGASGPPVLADEARDGEQRQDACKPVWSRYLPRHSPARASRRMPRPPPKAQIRPTAHPPYARSGRC